MLDHIGTEPEDDENDGKEAVRKLLAELLEPVKSGNTEQIYSILSREIWENLGKVV